MNDQLTLDDYRLSRQVGTREHEETIEARFQRFHHDHPEVYAEIVRLAREWVGRGTRARWSIDGAIEGRWCPVCAAATRTGNGR